MESEDFTSEEIAMINLLKLDFMLFVHKHKKDWNPTEFTAVILPLILAIGRKFCDTDEFHALVTGCLNCSDLIVKKINTFMEEKQ